MRFSRFAHEPIQLSTGGVQRVLFRLGDARADQWPAVACDELSKDVFDVQPCQLIVVVTAPDELAAKRPEVVAMPAYGGLGQALVQQVEQERREQLNDLLTHDDVCGLDVP